MRAPRSRDTIRLPKDFPAHHPLRFSAQVLQQSLFCLRPARRLPQDYFYPPAEYLKHALNLILPADYRVQLAFFCHLCQIPAELIKGRRCAPSFSYSMCLRSQREIYCKLPCSQKVCTEASKCSARYSFVFAQNAEQKMFASYITVTDEPCFFYSEFKDFFARGVNGMSPNVSTFVP